MKTKLLVSILVIAMLFIAFMGLNVKAANGPSDTYSFIRFYNQDDAVSIYNSMGEQNGELQGVTYDKSSNTLTLNNFTENYAISANMMGDDFKLNLIGENSIPSMIIYGDGHGGSLTITGDGTLTVNENQDFSGAIWLEAEASNSAITISNTANVHLYGEEGVIVITYTKVDSASKAVVLRNGQDISANIIKENAKSQETVLSLHFDDTYNDYTVYTKDGKKYGMIEEDGLFKITNNQIAYDEVTEKYFLDRTTSTLTDSYHFYDYYIEYNTLEEIAAAGYQATEEEIRVTGCDVGMWALPVYKDSNNVKYAVQNYNNGYRIYDIMERQITLSDGHNYKFLALNTEVDYKNLTESIVTLDDLFNYTVNLKELMITAGEENVPAEEPTTPSEEQPLAPTEESTTETKPAEEQAKPQTDTKTEAKEVKLETADAKSAEDVSAKKEVGKLLEAVVKKEKVEGINEELAKKILEKVENGEQLFVEVTTKEIKADEIKQDVEKVEKKIEQNTKVVAYFDIGVLVKTASENLGNVTDLGDKISLTVDMPKDIPALAAGYTRTYKVIRVHDGVAEELETKVVGDKITFTSDKFSTYALTYTDTKTTGNPKTGDVITLYIAMFAVAAVGIVTSVKFIKRK